MLGGFGNSTKLFLNYSYDFAVYRRVYVSVINRVNLFVESLKIESGLSRTVDSFNRVVFTTANYVQHVRVHIAVSATTYVFEKFCFVEKQTRDVESNGTAIEIQIFGESMRLSANVHDRRFQRLHNGLSYI